METMNTVNHTMNTEITIESLLAPHGGMACSTPRREMLEVAIALGADLETLEILRDASRISRILTIRLPAHRYEGLSRGRGWARKGRGDSVEWGEKASGGYRVGPGEWDVGATDGFSRKGSVHYVVSHVQVGPETWTIAV